jgi:hypothetical protein
LINLPYAFINSGTPSSNCVSSASDRRACAPIDRHSTLRSGAESHLPVEGSPAVDYPRHSVRAPSSVVPSVNSLPCGRSVFPNAFDQAVAPAYAGRVRTGIRSGLTFALFFWTPASARSCGSHPVGCPRPSLGESLPSAISLVFHRSPNDPARWPVALRPMACRCN